MPALAEKLTELRAARGWSREKVARAADVTLTSYWRYETGRTVPGIEIVARLAAVYEVTVDELIGVPA